MLHATQEWYDLYSPERTEDLNQFFDHYLKDIKNDWTESPPVRLALLNYTKPAIVDKVFADLPWHLPSAVSRQLFLTPGGKLSTDNASNAGELQYQADTKDSISFTYEFPSRTVICGPSTLSVDIAAPEHNDLDVYTHVFKASKDGTILSHKNIPTPDTLSPEEEAKGTNNRVFRYWGPQGILRASQRHVSAEKSGKIWKTLSHEYVQHVKPGEVVRLDVQLWPTGMVFEAGEKLILKIGGEKLGVPAMGHLPNEPNKNRGKHIVHVGGKSDSHFQFFTTEA